MQNFIFAKYLKIKISKNYYGNFKEQHWLQLDKIGNYERKKLKKKRERDKVLRRENLETQKKNLALSVLLQTLVSFCYIDRLIKPVLSKLAVQVAILPAVMPERDTIHIPTG